MTKNLVTGATGFIGSHIAERLLNNGEEVTALVRKTSDVVFLRHIGANLSYGDLSDPVSVRNAVKGVDVVYHSAALADEWIDKNSAHLTNVEGTRNILEASRSENIKRLIFISSLAVLGMRNHHGTTADSPYGKTGDSYIDTKIDAEILARDYYNIFNLPVTVIRPGFVFGPRDDKLIPRISSKLKNGQFKFIGNGANKINAVYIDNLIDAILLASKNDAAAGKVYNVTNDSSMTIEGFINAIADTFGIDRPKEHIPKAIAYFLCGILTGWAKINNSKTPPFITKTRVKFLSLNLDFDIKKTRDELGYTPRVSIEEGIKRTKDYLCGNS